MKTLYERRAHIIARAPISPTNTAFTATSTAEVAIGAGPGANLLRMTPSTACRIRFGTSGLGAASASDAPLEAGVQRIFTIGNDCTHFRVIRQTADGVLTWDVVGKV